MAIKRKPTKRNVVLHEEDNTPKNDFQRLLMHIEENPLTYVAAVGFIALCIVVGVLFRVQSTLSDRNVMTAYAKAATEEDEKVKLEKLEELAAGSNRWTAEILYMTGETAIAAQEYEKAEAAFKRVREDFSTSPQVANAVDALAFLAENRGDLDAALKGYRELTEKWGDSLAGKRAYFKIASILEEQGDFKAAKEAYEAQAEQFPESRVAKRAEVALEKLAEAHPDLFPKEEEEVATAEKADETATEEAAQEDANEETTTEEVAEENVTEEAATEDAVAVQ